LIFMEDVGIDEYVAKIIIIIITAVYDIRNKR
jgi:hypothetical protein